MLEEKQWFADAEEGGDGVVGKELLTETIPESSENLSLTCNNSSGDNSKPLSVMDEDGVIIICVESTLLDRGFGADGSIALRGANFIPKLADVLALPLPVILLLPLGFIRL